MFVARREHAAPARVRAYGSMLALQLTMLSLFRTVFWLTGGNPAIAAIAAGPFVPDDDANRSADESSRILKWVRSWRLGKSIRQWSRRVPMLVMATALDVATRVLAPDASVGPLIGVTFARHPLAPHDPPAIQTDKLLGQERVLEVFRMATRNKLRWKHDCSGLPACHGCQQANKAALGFAVFMVRSAADPAPRQAATLFEMLKAMVESDEETVVDETCVAGAAKKLKVLAFDAPKALSDLRCGKMRSSHKR